jgi:hypothetical protein
MKINLFIILIILTFSIENGKIKKTLIDKYREDGTLIGLN